MEVKCYLKAEKKKNIKNPFINKNLPALFCLLLLTRQFDKAGVIPFLSIPLKEGFLKFHTPRNYTSTCSPSDIQILCDFRDILSLNRLNLFIFVDFSFSLLSYTGCPRKASDLNLNDFANF